MTRYERCKLVYPDLKVHEVAEGRLRIREGHTVIGFKRFYVCDDNEKFESKTVALVHEVEWLMRDWK